MNAKTHKKVVETALDFMWNNAYAEPLMKSAIRLLVWKTSQMVNYQGSFDISVNGFSITLEQGTFPVSPTVFYDDFVKPWILEKCAEIDRVNDTWVSGTGIVILFAEDQNSGNLPTANTPQYVELSNFNGYTVTSFNHFINMTRPGEFNASQHDGYAYKYSLYKNLGTTPSDADWFWGLFEGFQNISDWEKYSKDLAFAWACDLATLKIYKPGSFSPTCFWYNFDSGKPESNWEITPIADDDNRNKCVIWNSIDNLGMFWGKRFLEQSDGESEQSIHNYVEELAKKDLAEAYFGQPGYWPDCPPNTTAGYFSHPCYIKCIQYAHCLEEKMEICEQLYEVDQYPDIKRPGNNFLTSLGYALHAATDIITAPHIVPTLGNMWGNHSEYEKFIESMYREDTLPHIVSYDCSAEMIYPHINPLKQCLQGCQGTDAAFQSRELLRKGAQLAMDKGAKEMVELKGPWQDAEDAFAASISSFSSYIGQPGYWPDCPPNTTAGYLSHPCDTKCIQYAHCSEEKKEICELLYDYDNHNIYNNKLEIYFENTHELWKQEAYKFINTGIGLTAYLITHLCWNKWGQEIGVNSDEVFQENVTDHYGTFVQHPYLCQQKQTFTYADDPKARVVGINIKFDQRTVLDPHYRLVLWLKVRRRIAHYDDHGKFIRYQGEPIINETHAHIEYKDYDHADSATLTIPIVEKNGYITAEDLGHGAGRSYWEYHIDTGFPFIENYSGEIVRIVVDILEFSINALPINPNITSQSLDYWGYEFDIHPVGEALEIRTDPELWAMYESVTMPGLENHNQSLTNYVFDQASPGKLYSNHPHAVHDLKIYEFQKKYPFLIDYVHLKFSSLTDIGQQYEMKIYFEIRSRIAQKVDDAWEYAAGEEVNSEKAAIFYIAGNGYETCYYGKMTQTQLSACKNKTLKLLMLKDAAELPFIEEISPTSKKIRDIRKIKIEIALAPEATTGSPPPPAWGYTLASLTPHTVVDPAFTNFSYPYYFSQHPHSAYENKECRFPDYIGKLVYAIKCAFDPDTQLGEQYQLRISLFIRTRHAKRVNGYWEFEQAENIQESPAAIAYKKEGKSVYAYGVLNNAQLQEAKGQSIHLIMQSNSVQYLTIENINDDERIIRDIRGIKTQVRLNPAYASGMVPPGAWGYALTEFEPMCMNLSMQEGNMYNIPEDQFQAIMLSRMYAENLPHISILQNYWQSMDKAIISFLKNPVSEHAWEAELPDLETQFIELYNKEKQNLSNFKLPLLFSTGNGDQYRAPYKKELSNAATYSTYLKASINYNIRTQLLQVLLATSFIRAYLQDKSIEWTETQRNKVNQTLENGIKLKNALTGFLKDFNRPHAPMKYVINKNSKETHSLEKPCSWVGRIKARNKMFCQIKPEKYKWCDYCFPEKADK